MDWVHCNKCYYQPGKQPKRDFRLSSCGHIFCNSCEVIGSIEKCKICDVPCTTIVLSPEMREDVQMYFEEEEEIVKKLVKVIDFHSGHRKKLNEYYRLVADKYMPLKTNYCKIVEENKRVHQDNKRIHQENKRIHQENKRIQQENEILKQKLEGYKRLSSHKMLTPPQSQSKPQISPLFSGNLQASNRSFDHNSSFQSSGSESSPASSLFLTPTLKGPFKNYRHQRQLTPGTPGYDIRDSQGSDRGGIGYGGTQSQMVQPQIHRYSSGFTTPISGMQGLSVKHRT